LVHSRLRCMPQCQRSIRIACWEPECTEGDTVPGIIRSWLCKNGQTSTEDARHRSRAEELEVSTVRLLSGQNRRLAGAGSPRRRRRHGGARRPSSRRRPSAASRIAQFTADRNAKRPPAGPTGAWFKRSVFPSTDDSGTSQVKRIASRAVYSLNGWSTDVRSTPDSGGKADMQRLRLRASNRHGSGRTQIRAFVAAITASEPAGC
jgi:hypothetical protein